jgi:glycosyltransferase involved in cell wall biosynthesis
VKPLKVLVAAYACRPHLGSEPGVGWNLVRELVKYHHVWLLTRTNNEAAITSELALNPLPNLNVVYTNIPRFCHFLHGKAWGVYLRYYLWQWQAYQAAHSLHQEIGFEIVHHLTYSRYCDPSLLALLPLPFVWGPLGGGESAPYSFWADFQIRGQLYELVRDLSRWLGEHSPLVRYTAQRCSTALVSTRETAERLKLMGVNNLKFIAGQTGINQDELDRLQKRQKDADTDVTSLIAPITGGQPIRFLSLGRLLHWKGFHLGLQGFAAADLHHSEYWIVGDGPARPHLEALAKKLGIAQRVKWLGTLPREQALDTLIHCDVLVHPSLHDFSPTVCLEAMAAGRPVLCLDLGGPAGQITPETGIRVPAHSPQQTIEDLGAAMIQLANNPSLRQQMGQAGQARVQEFYSWERKGKRYAELYNQLCQPS